MSQDPNYRLVDIVQYRRAVEPIPCASTVAALTDEDLDFYVYGTARTMSAVLAKRALPGAEWFAGAEFNSAEHAFLRARDGEPAIISRS